MSSHAERDGGFSFAFKSLFVSFYSLPQFEAKPLPLVGFSVLLAPRLVWSNSLRRGHRDLLVAADRLVCPQP